MERTDLQIKTGTIAELCQAIRKVKNEYSKKLDALNKDNTYSAEYKKEIATRYKATFDSKVLELQADIKQAIEEIKGEVFKPLESMTEIMQSVDYLATMKSAGAVTDRMISNEIEKFRGNENAMIYFRQKMKDAGVSTVYFDDNMFSEYQRDINGNTKFVEPTAYFDALERTISNGNDILIAYALRTTEKIIGVESAGLKNYDAEITQDSTPTPSVI